MTLNAGSVKKGALYIEHTFMFSYEVSFSWYVLYCDQAKKLVFIKQIPKKKGSRLGKKNMSAVWLRRFQPPLKQVGNEAHTYLSVRVSDKVEQWFNCDISRFLLVQRDPYHVLS